MDVEQGDRSQRHERKECVAIEEIVLKKRQHAVAEILPAADFAAVAPLLNKICNITEILLDKIIPCPGENDAGKSG